MAVFAISDLHLSLGVNKPMDMFGGNWVNYTVRIKQEWEKIITEYDSVIIPGDISWATYLEQSTEDFEFLNALPGEKIVLKGNHDYWWTTLKKLNDFMQKNKFYTIKFLHNNCYKVNNIVLCGTRGWKCPGDEDFDEEDRKIYLRELQRLELSLKCAKKASEEESPHLPIIAVMHYMPFNTKKQPSDFIQMLKEYNVKMCLYGHLHGDGIKNAVEGIIDGIDYKLISADYLEFKPIKLEC